MADETRQFVYLHERCGGCSSDCRKCPRFRMLSQDEYIALRNYRRVNRLPMYRLKNKKWEIIKDDEND